MRMTSRHAIRHHAAAASCVAASIAALTGDTPEATKTESDE
ncbi:hypothetical protein [Myceligenerans xiligouense]|nr:hypothetical protein [Myceligenerans xiligouense]